MRLKLNIYWWLNPVATVIITLIPFVISAHLLSGSDYFEQWRTQKHLNEGTAYLCLGVIASFIGGAFVNAFFFQKKKPAVGTKIPHARLQILFAISFLAALTGYLCWAVVCYMHGVGITQMISIFRGDFGAVYAIRDLGATVPGITTATQFGMAASIFGALLWIRYHSRHVGILLLALVFMAMLRAFLWSERLATIEIVVPMLIVLFGRRDWRSQPRLQFLIGLAPILGGISLYLYFTGSEYFRSWGHYSQAGGSIWYFSWMRLCGYYITALNNGALMQAAVGTLPFPFTTLEFFWKFPGISSLLPYNQIFSVDPYVYQDSLKEMGNPEFNNPSGIFPYMVDFGLMGGCIFWFVVGWISNNVHAAFKRGTLAGLLFFPLLYVSFLEISRIPYLTASRTFPSWIMLLFAYFLLQTGPGKWNAATRSAAVRPTPKIRRKAGTIRLNKP